MIAYLKGEVAEVLEGFLVIDVQGIGYKVAVGGGYAASLKPGQKVKIATYHHVTDASEALFGFRDVREQTYFERLLAVPSVGPRTALSILDMAPPKTLAGAVARGDAKLLTRVPGVGKKTAERIVMELEGKLSVAGDEDEGEPGREWQAEAISALANLGFSQAVAGRVVSEMPKSVTSVEEAVRYALQQNAVE